MAPADSAGATEDAQAHALFLVERGHRFHRPRAPRLRRALGVEAVERALRPHLLQGNEVHLRLLPVARATGAQGLVPELELIFQARIELRRGAERLVDRDGF